MPEITCKFCGRTFTTYPSKPRIYCSTVCKTKDKTTKVTCRTCGKVSVVPKSLADRPYCSRACMAACKKHASKISASKTKERVVVHCKTCDKPIEVLASKAWRKKYCSRSCRSSDPSIIAKLIRAQIATKHCAQCGKKIVRYKSQYRESDAKAFCNMDCLGLYRAENVEFAQRLLEIRKAAGEAPNKLERFVDEQFPELAFVGDGKLWIKTEDNRRKCPDFILPGTNKIVELWGDYWHDGEVPEDEVNRYAELGYDCLVVWESEIKRDWQGVSARIAEFCQS